MINLLDWLSRNWFFNLCEKPSANLGILGAFSPRSFRIIPPEVCAGAFSLPCGTGQVVTESLSETEIPLPGLLSHAHAISNVNDG